MKTNERLFVLRQEFFTPGREMFEVNRYLNEIIVKAAEGKKPTNEDVLKQFIEYISSIGTDRLQSLSYIFVDEVKEIIKSIQYLRMTLNGYLQLTKY